MANTDGKNLERDGGAFTSTVTDADILAAVAEHTPAATSEVADSIDMTRAGAHNRLNDLHDSGEVEKKKVAASVVWFLD